MSGGTTAFVFGSPTPESGQHAPLSTVVSVDEHPQSVTGGNAAGIIESPCNFREMEAGLKPHRWPWLNGHSMLNTTMSVKQSYA